MRPRLVSGINRLRGCLEYDAGAVTLLRARPHRAACFREDIGMRAGRCADGRVAVIRHYNDYTRHPFAASRTGDPGVNALPLLDLELVCNLAQRVLEASVYQHHSGDVED